MSDAAQRAWSAMRALVLDHDRRKDVAAALGLSFIRSKALTALAPGPLTARELGERIGTDAPHTSVIVRDLEAAGLVSRTPHPTDRRAKLVSLTGEGAKTARRVTELLETPPAALERLSDADLERIAKLLERAR